MNTEVYCISESNEVDVIQLGYFFIFLVAYICTNANLMSVNSKIIFVSTEKSCRLQWKALKFWRAPWMPLKLYRKGKYGPSFKHDSERVAQSFLRHRTKQCKIGKNIKLNEMTNFTAWTHLTYTNLLRYVLEQPPHFFILYQNVPFIFLCPHHQRP